MPGNSQVDAIHFANGEKLDSLAVDEGDVSQIQGDLAVGVFQPESLRSSSISSASIRPLRVKMTFPFVFLWIQHLMSF